MHTHDTKQFVRLHVEEGGVLQLQWAHPDFANARKAPYAGRSDSKIDPHVHKLDGEVVFAAKDPRGAAELVQELADTYEGLYPEGLCEAKAEKDQVRVRMEALNLDAHQLIATLGEVAEEMGVELRSVQKQQDSQVIEWGRLQLQNSTLATHSNVETRARKDLKMRLPEDVELVRLQ